MSTEKKSLKKNRNETEFSKKEEFYSITIQ